MTPQELRDLADELADINREVTRRMEPTDELHALCIAARQEGMSQAVAYIRGKARSL